MCVPSKRLRINGVGPSNNCRYPLAMQGVRFHEVYGSDISWQLSGGSDGFPLDPSVFTVFTDACADSGNNRSTSMIAIDDATHPISYIKHDSMAFSRASSHILYLLHTVHAGMVLLINDHTWYFRTDPGRTFDTVYCAESADVLFTQEHLYYA